MQYYSLDINSILSYDKWDIIQRSMLGALINLSTIIRWFPDSRENRTWKESVPSALEIFQCLLWYVDICPEFGNLEIILARPLRRYRAIQLI